MAPSLSNVCTTMAPLIFEPRSHCGTIFAGKVEKCTRMAPLYQNGFLMILLRSHSVTLSLTFPANEDIENFQMSVSLIFQFKESQFLLRIVAEYIGDVIFV